MVPFMMDRLWRAVSMVFSGRVNISFTYACTIKDSSSDINFTGPPKQGHFFAILAGSSNNSKQHNSKQHMILKNIWIQTT